MDSIVVVVSIVVVIMVDYSLLRAADFRDELRMFCVADWVIIGIVMVVVIVVGCVVVEESVKMAKLGMLTPFSCTAVCCSNEHNSLVFGNLLMGLDVLESL